MYLNSFNPFNPLFEYDKTVFVIPFVMLQRYAFFPFLGSFFGRNVCFCRKIIVTLQPNFDEKMKEECKKYEPLQESDPPCACESGPWELEEAVELMEPEVVAMPQSVEELCKVAEQFETEYASATLQTVPATEVFRMLDHRWMQ